ncbi:MAG TPA: AAA family ATPase, partial [Acidimicrobiales bacterium]
MEPMVAAGERRAPPGRRSVLATTVVGRDFEVRALGEALDGATAGRGGVVFLVGEAGIGKSRLAQVASADAEVRGLAVLRGRAVPTSTPVAYRPLAEALCAAVRAGLGADAPELAPFRTTLGWLVPEWRSGDHRGPDSVVALAEAVLRFLRVAARHRGCLVVLEDLHWADPETLTILEYLADNLTTEPALCLTTLRAEDRSQGLDLARALQARRASQLFEISRLDSGDVTDMVRSCLNVSTLPDQVLDFAARAEGVPFLVEELLAVAVTSGVLVSDGESWTVSETVEPVVPVTFSDSIRRRLGALDEETRAVLFGAAVLGRRFDWALVPRIAGLGQDAVLAALHAAVDNHILSVDSAQGGFRFRHALSRDAVVAQLLPPERATLSSRALEAVEAAQPGLPAGWCELAAELAEGAGERARAAGLLLDAGRRALRGGALASAEVTLERARTLSAAEGPTILDVEECLTQVLSLAGKRDRAVEVGESLLARLGDDPRGASRRAETYLKLARAAVAATDWEDAHRLVEQARSQAGPAPDERFTARVNGVAAQTAIMRDPQRAPSLARDALEAAERFDLPEVACEALEILGRAQRPHDLEAAEAAFGRALAIADHHALSVWRVRALHELGTIALLRGGPPTRLQEARDLALDQGALATAAIVDVQIAAALVMRDDAEEAAAAALRASDVARRYGLHQTLAAALG